MPGIVSRFILALQVAMSIPLVWYSLPVAEFFLSTQYRASIDNAAVPQIGYHLLDNE